MKTFFYNNRRIVRSEKALTLKKYVELGRLEAGQYILIGEMDEKGTRNTQGFWIGDATPYHEPSIGDGGFGWDYNAPMMALYVIEVNTYS